MSDTINVTTDTVTSWISDQLDAKVSRDQIIISMMSKYDYTLNKATQTYGKYAKANGLTSTVASHKDAAIKFLETVNLTRPWDAHTVKDSVIDMIDKFGIAESTARDYAKAYSEKLKVEHPVEDPRAMIFAWVVANVNHMSRDELKKGLIEYACGPLGRSRSNANEYAKGLDLHFAIMDARYAEAAATAISE